MEEILTGEQPAEETPADISEGAQPQENKEDIAGFPEGSPYGKFKSATELLKAYVGLEKEFTRKSQQLAEFNKKETTHENLTAVYERDDWHERVSKFRAEHPEAAEYSEEIADLILKDKNIGYSADPLLSAYALVFEKKQKTPSVLAGDKEFVEKYILNNPDIKQTFINDYLNLIKTNAETPPVMSVRGACLGDEIVSVPKTLAEANLLTKKLMETKK